MEYKNYVEHYKFDGEYYDYFSVDKFMEQELKRRYEEIVQQSKLSDGCNLLEIGTGSGPALSVLKTNRLNYFPFDISHHNIKRINQISTNKIYPSVGDCLKLPFKDASFDNVIMSEVLEHLQEPLESLREIKRILKRGGLLIITVPYNETIRYEICIHCNNPTPIHSHLHSFSPGSLTNLVKEVGLWPVKFSKNINKIPHRLYIYRIIKFFPFKIWKIIDSVFNYIIDKPISLILVCKKRTLS